MQGYDFGTNECSHYWSQCNYDLSVITKSNAMQYLFASSAFGSGNLRLIYSEIIGLQFFPSRNICLNDCTAEIKTINLQTNSISCKFKPFYEADIFIGRLQKGVLDTFPPVSNFVFIFIQLSRKIGQKNRLVPLPSALAPSVWEILDSAYSITSFFGICLVIKWPPLFHRLLWFW